MYADVLLRPSSSTTKDLDRPDRRDFFLLPFSIACLIFFWPSVRNSWRVWEQSPDPDGPARYPIKTAILICFVLLFLQGLSQIIHCIETLRRLGRGS